MPSSISARGCFRAPALGIIGAPVLLLIELVCAYAIVPWTCKWALPAAFHAVIGATLLFALCIAGVSWRHLAPVEIRRERFLGILGLTVSAMVTLVMALQWITAFIVPPCVSSF